MPARKPAKCALHRFTGQARVRLNGMDHWLGKYGSRESMDRYGEILRKWSITTEQATEGMTVGQLSLAFMK